MSRILHYFPNERIPNELVDEIAAHVGNRADLRRWFENHGTHIKAYKDRRSPYDYLKQTGYFQDVDQLLRVMWGNDAVLSGSRALDWFVPGSAEKSSDWDFYVPNNPCAVRMVKEALERSGVRFKTCLDHAIDDLNSKGFTILDEDQILSFIFKHSLEDLQQEDPQMIKIIKGIWKMYPILESESPLDYTQWKFETRIPDITSIKIETNGDVSRWLEDELEDTYNLKVIQGYVGEESIGVQLILTPTDQSALSGNALQSVFASIIQFNASHVQCFLTKHVAAHMYHDLAKDKKAYLWLWNTADDPMYGSDHCEERMAQWIKKYTRREYDFILANTGLRNCSFDDTGAYFETFDAKTLSYSDLRKIKMIRSIRWQYCGTNIIQVDDVRTLRSQRHLIKYGVLPNVTYNSYLVRCTKLLEEQAHSLADVILERRPDLHVARE
jgi:hypothetical protein